MPTSVLKLSVVDYRTDKRYIPKEVGVIAMTGKSADEIVQEVWERFNVTQQGDRELIAQGLSSPSKYDSLAYFFKGKDEISYRIQAVHCDRGNYFPQRSVQEILPKRNQEVYFKDMTINGWFSYPSEKSFTDQEIAAKSGEYPEMAALWNSESFRCIIETNSRRGMEYRMFSVYATK